MQQHATRHGIEARLRLLGNARVEPQRSEGAERTGGLILQQSRAALHRAARHQRRRLLVPR
ncbi:MAG: hypothetical protein MZV65_34055 [Chromatiales bacterium]|nr:hypothetical protein [Chromatiales bacterium]